MPWRPASRSDRAAYDVPARGRVRWSLTGLAGAVLSALVLAGCGADAPSPAPARTPPASSPRAAEEVAAAEALVPPPVAPTDPQASADPRAALSDLAALAEQAAGDVVPVPVPPAGAQPQVLGGDISWPQCPTGLGIPERRTLGLPAPLPSARFVVIGLTNGPGFFANPCLADQVSLARSRGLQVASYSVLSYPDAATLEAYGGRGPHDAGTPEGLLRNVGWAQALFNIESMLATGLETPMVWLDIESVPGFDWSADTAANAAVVQGAARGYTDAGYRIGVYSTPYLWQQIVGDLALGVPEWRPAGPSSRAAAEARCGDDWVIQGGAAVIVQWVEQRRDLNVTCPRMPGTLTDWFHRF